MWSSFLGTKNLKTGDLLLFHGERYWFSELIELATNSRFSHVGIYYEDNGVGYLFESGYEPNGTVGVAGTFGAAGTFGVQLTPWDYVRKNYTGEIYVRRLTSQEIPNLSPLYQELKGKPYDTNILHFLRAYLGVPIGDCQETHSFFCSALSAYIYTEIGYLAKDTKWDLISPEMMSKIELLSPARLGEVEEIKEFTSSCTML